MKDGTLSLEYLEKDGLYSAYCSGVATPNLHPDPIIALYAAVQHGKDCLGSILCDSAFSNIPAVTPDCHGTSSFKEMFKKHVERILAQKKWEYETCQKQAAKLGIFE